MGTMASMVMWLGAWVPAWSDPREQGPIRGGGTDGQTPFQAPSFTRVAAVHSVTWLLSLDIPPSQSTILGAAHRTGCRLEYGTRGTRPGQQVRTPRLGPGNGEQALCMTLTFSSSAMRLSSRGLLHSK